MEVRIADSSCLTECSGFPVWSGLLPAATSHECVRSNICRVLAASASSHLVTSRSSFFEALNTFQKLKISFEPTHGGPHKRFESKTTAENAVVRRFIGNESSNWMLETEERSHVGRCVENAIARLDELEPGFADAFASLVGELLFARLEHFGGGSVSDLIGVIWLSPSHDWSENNYAENIVHEYVHQALFLDEMVNTIFAESVPRMAEDDATVRSAILQRRRGYDKAYHSAFVSYTLLNLRRLVGAEGEHSSNLDPLLVTLDELVMKSNFLTDHGRAILIDLTRRVLSLRDSM
jgi:hypothetical protein